VERRVTAMEIRNYPSRQQAAFTPEHTVTLKVGEIYEATVKEKINAYEAIVNIKGTDIRVRTEGDLPERGRVAIEVKGQQDSMPEVKVVSQEQNTKPQANDIASILTKLGLGESAADELKQAGKLLLSKDMPLTKETVSVLKTFFAEASGTVEQKLDTIRALVNKGLEVTRTQVMAVHEALHGKPLGEVLTTIAKQLDANFTFTKQETENVKITAKEMIANARKKIQHEPNFIKVIEQVKELTKSLQADEAMSEALNKVIREADVLHKKGQEAFARSQIVQTLVAMEKTTVQGEHVQSKMGGYDLAEQMKKVREQVQREPLAGKAVAIAKEKIVHNGDIPDDVRQKIAEELQGIERLQQNGQPLSAKAKLIQALTQVENEAVASGKTPEVQVSDAAEQTVQALRNAKEIIRNITNWSEMTQRLKNEIINRVDEKTAHELETLITRLAITQKMGKDLLLHSLEKIEKDIVIKQGDYRGRLLENEKKQTELMRWEKAVKQIQQVRDQIISQPNLSKAVAQAREQVVDNPEMNQDVARKVDQALREVTQLEQQNREGEARVRLMKTLTQAEEALRGNEGKPPTSQNLAELVKDVRSQVMKEADLTKALMHVRTQLVHNGNVPVEIQQKIEKAIKDSSMLQQIGRETFAKNHLIRTLEQIENAAAAKEQKPQAALFETIQQVKQTIAKAETIEAAVREIRQQLHRFTDQNIVTHLTKAMVEAAKLDKSGREQLITTLTNLESEQTKNAVTNENGMSSQHVRDAVREAIKTMQREANLEKAFDFIKTETMPRLNKEPELWKKLTDSFTKALQLQENGRELAARQTMLETLKEIETSLPQAVNGETDHSTSLDNLFDFEWQTSLQLQTKDIIVQTITKKMSQAAIDFKNTKRDIMRNLETISQLIEKYKQSAQPQAKQLLETTIKQLDNAILKSDMMLFTDMTTEKQLMKASSQLAEAKKRLNKGDYSGAQKIVKEVKDALEKIQFKPSDVKVKHFVANESLKFADSPKEFLMHMNKTVQPFAFEPSARQMFETIRRLGLTHDYEVAESLVFKGNNEEAPQQNMKAMFLKLVQSGNEQVVQQVEQALNNLTGQQLLNKFDTGANAQSFFFTLPLLLQNEVQSVKVYVNSRKDGERIDWENCSLYFLLETKKLGDIGILLNANERNLSITFRNDKADFAQKVQPLVDVAKERLEEIGYRVTGVNVTKLTIEAVQTQETAMMSRTKPYATFTEKGYDFTI
jgi:hypothetical protein